VHRCCSKVKALGALLDDVLRTSEEYRTIADGLADSGAPTIAPTALSSWLATPGEEVGRTSRNEPDLHLRAPGTSR